MPVGYTILLLSAKTRQGNQRNEASRLRKCIKKSSALSFAWNAKKSLCKLNSLHCHQKTTTSLWKLERKGNWRKRNCGHKLIMHSITRRDEMWGGGGGVKWEDSGGGGGGRLLYTNLYMSRVKWYDNTHKLFNSIKKGLLLTVIQIRGTAETRRCVADAVRLPVITLNAPLTLRASYLPLPPPAPPPVLVLVPYHRPR